MNSTRAAIPLIVLYALCGLAVTQFVPNWRLTHLFAKGPQTAELKAAQADAAKAKADADAAEAKLAAANAAAEQARTGQLQNVQWNVTGIPLALQGEAPTPGVILAQTLATNALGGLNSAIGTLPADQQAAIKAAVAEIRSGDLAQIAEGKAALAAKQAELVSVTQQAEAVKAQIPVLQAQVTTTEAAKQAAEATVTAKTAEVVAYADKAAAELKENGGLRATVQYWAIVAALAYLFVHFALPSLAAEFPTWKIITVPYRWITSLLSSHVITQAEGVVKAQVTAVESQVAKSV